MLLIPSTHRIVNKLCSLITIYALQVVKKMRKLCKRPFLIGMSESLYRSKVHIWQLCIAIPFSGPLNWQLTFSRLTSERGTLVQRCLDSIHNVWSDFFYFAA